MKPKAQLTLFFCLATMLAFSQGSLPVKPDLKPAPKNLRILAKPDLIITDVKVISATGGIDKDWDIRLSVTVKNTGGIITPATKFKATAQNAASASNPWKNFGVAECPKVDPGKSVVVEVRFVDKAWVMHKVPGFNLILKADATNIVAEGSEDNNSSTGILIGL